MRFCKHLWSKHTSRSLFVSSNGNDYRWLEIQCQSKSAQGWQKENNFPAQSRLPLLLWKDQIFRRVYHVAHRNARRTWTRWVWKRSLVCRSSVCFHCKTRTPAREATTYIHLGDQFRRELKCRRLTFWFHFKWGQSAVWSWDGPSWDYYRALGRCSNQPEHCTALTWSTCHLEHQ